MKKTVHQVILDNRPLYFAFGAMNVVKGNIPGVHGGGRRRFMTKFQHIMALFGVFLLLLVLGSIAVNLIAAIDQLIPRVLVIVVSLLILAAIIYYTVRFLKTVKRIKSIKAHRRYASAGIDHSWSDAQTAAEDAATSVEKMVVYREFENRRTFRLYSQIIDDIAVAGQPELPLSITGEQIRYWFYDIQTDLYHETRYGPRKYGERYYTVLEMKLRRVVPHLIFDSKDANKQQLKSIYDSRQKLDALPALQDFFTVYAPQHHAVETLSFITPEVIEAMIEIRECDLEFVGDSLFCYAPLLDGNELANLRQSGFLLHSKVNDNLPTHSSQIAQTDPFARQLLANPWRSLPATIIAAVLTVALIWVGSWIYAALFGIGTFFLLYNIISTRRKNKRLVDSFLKKR